MNNIKLISAMVTPFDDEDNIDFEVLKRILDNNGLGHDGFLIGGSTGEGDSLREDELQKLISFYQSIPGIKILNISVDCTFKVIELINKMEIPEDYIILIRVPAYYLASQEGMINHFTKIFSSFPKKKFMVYDIPKRTGSTLDINSIYEIKCKANNFIGIKDCTNSFDRVKKLSKFIDVYGGNDEMAYEYLNCGVVGLISVFSIIENEYFRKIIRGKKVNKPECFNLGLGNPLGIKTVLKNKGYKSMNLRGPLKIL